MYAIRSYYALVYSELPEKFKNIILKPYVSPKHNQLRYSIRIKDSEKSLRRNALLTKIRYDLVNKLGLEKKQIHLTGRITSYNVCYTKLLRLLAKRALSDMKEVTQTAEDISKGSYNRRVQIKRRFIEIERLGAAFNSMLDRILV